MMAALAGMLYSGKLSQLYLGMGDTYQMASVSAVAIGGISLVGGSGGGRPDSATAGGKNPAKLEEALEAVNNIVDALL